MSVARAPYFTEFANSSRRTRRRRRRTRDRALPSPRRSWRASSPSRSGVRFLAFSTEVLDFSEQVADPLSLLLEVQVGGGTDIGLGLRAARAGVTVPSRSIVILVSDFEEGVSVGRMIAEVRELVDAGVKCLGLASLDDRGVARYHQGYAAMMAGAGMPVAAVSPERF